MDYKNKISYCIADDTTYGRDWFKQLFNDTSVEFDTSSEVGKEKVCDLAECQLVKGKTVLILMDACSFGPCVTSLRELSYRFPSRMVFLSNLKSFEYLLLSSNMFNKLKVNYDETVKGFEEKYYEDILSRVSNTGHCHVKHGITNKISLCYTSKCCPYTERNGCNVGLSGEDKFVAMLRGTEFESLYKLAGR